MKAVPNMVEFAAPCRTLLALCLLVGMSLSMDRDTTTIQLGVYGTGLFDWSNLSQPAWCIQPNTSTHSTPIRPNCTVSLNVNQPFNVAKHYRDMLEIYSGFSSVNDARCFRFTVRFQGNTLHGLTTFLDATSGHVRYCQPKNSINDDISLSARSNLMQKAALYCFHWSVIDPIPKLLKHLKWKTVIFITDHVTELFSDSILVKLSTSRINIIHQKISNNTPRMDIRVFLQNAYNRRAFVELNFILLCSENTTRRILKTVREIDAGRLTVMYMYSKWLILTNDEDLPGLSSTTDVLHNLAVVSFGLDKSSQETWWKDLPGSVRARVFTAICREGEKRELNSVGRWSLTRGWRITSDIFPNIKRGFNGREFTVGVLEWSPFVIENNTANTTFDGLCIDILNHLAAELNFSYVLTKPRDGKWGIHAANGLWGGIPRDLIDGVIDLSIAPMSFGFDRQDVLDYTHWYYYDYNVIMVKITDPSISNWRVLIDIFSWPVLLCTFFAVPTTATILYLLEACHPYPFPSSYIRTGWKRFGQYIWYSYGALLSQGGSGLPLTQAGRTMVAFWWLFSIMLTATFSGNLIAFLTVPVNTVPFSTLNQMIQQTTVKWGIHPESSIAEVLKNSNFTPYEEVWRGISYTDSDPVNHVNKVLEGDYAYIGDKSGGLFLMANKCDLHISKETFHPQIYAINFVKNSPYTEIFSDKVKQFVETGLVEKWKTNWWPTTNCTGAPPSAARKMTIPDVQSAFYVLVVGIGIGLSVLLVEHLLTVLKKVVANRKTKRRKARRKYRTRKTVIALEKLPENMVTENTVQNKLENKWGCMNWISSFPEGNLHLSESQTRFAYVDDETEGASYM